jgi:hypothetical protein
MSPSTPSVKSLAEKRVRRQKIFIGIGSVLLLAVLGYQMPKLLGHKSGQSAAPAVSTPTPGVAVAPVLTPGQLPGTDRVIVQRDSNQLISFGLFKSKDPFVQQLTTSADATPATPPTPAPSTPTSTEPTPAAVPPTGVPATTTPSVAPPGTTTPSSTTPTAPAPIPTSALIATNGVCEQVAVNGTFPATENIFRLASIAKDGKSVKIGIVGGSFDNGQPTATLKLGGKLTLVNTADGTRYVIELESKCANVAASGTTTTAATSTQPVSTTPVSPAPTPTTTTTDTVTSPIVTDSVDTTTPSS